MANLCRAVPTARAERNWGTPRRKIFFRCPFRFNRPTIGLQLRKRSDLLDRFGGGPTGKISGVSNVWIWRGGDFICGSEKQLSLGVGGAGRDTDAACGEINCLESCSKWIRSVRWERSGGPLGYIGGRGSGSRGAWLVNAPGETAGTWGDGFEKTQAVHPTGKTKLGWTTPDGGTPPNPWGKKKQGFYHFAGFGS